MAKENSSTSKIDKEIKDTPVKVKEDTTEKKSSSTKVSEKKEASTPKKETVLKPETVVSTEAEVAEKEAKEAIKEFKMEETLVKPVKSASKDTSGKFIQKKKKRKIRRQVQKGQAYIKATYKLF